MVAASGDCAAGRLSAIGYSERLIDSLKEADFDVLLSHGLWKYTSYCSLNWGRRTDRPVIIHPHGMLDEWAVRNSGWKKRVAGLLYENAHLRRASCIRALCEPEANSIRAYGLTNPICVLPNGIDLPRPGHASEPTRAAENQSRTLLYLGRLHPKKNLASLIKAWAEARDGNGRKRDSRQWRLVIAGWDQAGYESQLKRLAAALGVTDSVDFLGPVFAEAKEQAYGNADAFILPSLSEGLPMVVLEAWALCKPVLMTSACNLEEGFNANAALCIPTSVSGIATGLRELFATSDAERRAMGSRGADLVARKFSWREIGAEMRRVCEWVTNGGPTPNSVRLN